MTEAEYKRDQRIAIRAWHRRSVEAALKAYPQWKPRFKGAKSTTLEYSLRTEFYLRDGTSKAIQEAITTGVTYGYTGKQVHEHATRTNGTN